MSIIRRRTLVVLCAIALPLALYLSLNADATLNRTLCPSPGSAASQCEKPEGLAIDWETNRLVVADTQNHRVVVFDASSGEFLFAFGWGVDTGAAKLEACTTASSCQAGIAGSGAGQLKSPNFVAVDNSAGPSKGDIYVGESAANRVQKFSAAGAFLLAFGKGVNTGTSGKPNLCTNAGPPTDVCGAGSAGSGLGEFNRIRGIGVTGAGVVYVFDTKSEGGCEVPGVGGTKFKKRLQKFKENGEASEEIVLIDTPCGEVAAFAVESTGDFYVANEGKSAAIRKYDLSGALLKTLDPGIGTDSLAVDASDDLYAEQTENAKQFTKTYFVLTKHDGTGGDTLRRFGYGDTEGSLLGLAVSSSDHVFATERFVKILDLSEPAPGPIVAPPSLKAAPGATLATVKAEINPEGKASEFHFQYVTQQGYEEQGNSFTGGKTKETAPKPVGASDFALHGVEAQIGCANPAVEGPEEKCLVPETVYRFRILASNPDGSGNTPLDGGSFETRPAPEFLALWSSEVGPDSATLGVELNPFLIPTQGFFEYVTEAQFQATGFSKASKAPTAGGISFGEGEGAVAKEVPVFPLQAGTTYHYRLHATSFLNEAISEEGTLKTFATPQIEPCENDLFRYGLGALLPDCRGYEMVTPLDKGESDITPGEAPVRGGPAALDVSSISGDKLAYGTLRAFGDAQSAPYISQYIAARDPEAGWATHSLIAPRTKVILPIGSWVLDTEFKAFSPNLCEAWLVRVSEPLLDPAGIPGYPNLMRRVDQECEEGTEASYEAITRGKPLNLPPEKSGLFELHGVSADGTAALYQWNDNLEGASPTPAPQPAICASKGIECQPRLYEQKQGGPLEFICILPNGEPTPTPCQAGSPTVGGVSRGASVRNALSANGERVFWSATAGGTGPIYVRIDGTETVAVSKAAEEEVKTSNSLFWAASDDGTKAIFTTGERLYEFAVDPKTTTLVAKGVAGVVGVSEDAAKTYFVSTEAIAGSGENSEGNEAIAGKPNLYLRDAGFGGGIPFIATVATSDVNPTTGANPYLVAAQPFRRIHRVSADGTSLAFASAASPTGYDNTDANSGKVDTEVYLYDAGSDKLVCASCNPSGARPAGEFDEIILGRKLWVGAKIPAWTNILYAPRVLSQGGGRLFFESPDALLARDTNGLLDVYEWEAPGVGSCTEATYTYSQLNQGCIDLISSGKDRHKAEFVDASPTGDDVFFSYQQSLVGQDTDKLVDIYDARVGGGFPPPPPPPIPCVGESCRHPAEAPQFQTPSSEQFKGPGNVKERQKHKRCRKGTHKVKTKAGKVRCVKNHKRKQRQSGRAGR